MSFTFSKELTNIKCKEFINRSELTSITLPDNLETIGDYAFSDCTGLTNEIVEDINLKKRI